MNNLYILRLFLPLVACLAVLADDTEIDTRKMSILRSYFALTGFRIEPPKDSALNDYDDAVIEKMDELIKQDTKILDYYDKEAEINHMIYESQLKKAPRAEDCKPFEPTDEALLRTLNLVVPDPANNPDSEYPLAKKDLRSFYIEQPKLGKELLNRARSYLDEKELQTDDAARLLRNFYYHWIPLARLEEYIYSKSGD